MRGELWSMRTLKTRYGMRLAADQRMLESDAHEQAVLTEVRRLRMYGATMAGIAETLNARASRPGTVGPGNGLRSSNSSNGIRPRLREGDDDDDDDARDNTGGRAPFDCA